MKKQKIIGVVKIKTVRHNTNTTHPDCPNYETHDITVIGNFSRWNKIPRKYVISDTYRQIRNEFCADLLKHYKEYKDSNIMHRIKTRIEIVKKYAFAGEIVSFSAMVNDNNRITGRLSK